jgi:hypothetical protein
VTDSFSNPPSSGPNLTQVDGPTNFGRFAVRMLIALAIPTLAILLWIKFERQTPAATGEIARISIFPVQAKITGGAAGSPGMQGQDEIINQMMVLAHVRLHNPNQAPIRIEDDWAVVTLPDGETRRSLAANASDFEKVFVAYPQLAPLRMEPLRRDTVVQPGQTVDGLVIFSYPLSREQWDSRKSMQLTLELDNSKDVTLIAPQG